MNREIYNIEDDVSFNEMRDHIFIDNPNFTIKDKSVETDNYTFNLSPAYLDFIKQLEYKNDLIFGKDKTLNITAIEIEDDLIHLFKKDGSIETRPMQYFIASKRAIEYTFKVLKGDNHYKYLRKFDSREKYSQCMRMYQNDRIDIWNSWNDRESAMLLNGITLYKGMKLEELNVLAFDIESEGLEKHKDSKVYLITNTARINGKLIKKHFRLDNYNEDCGAMIDDWCTWVREMNPDVLTGHNFVPYDIPYLEHVAKLYDTKLKLGRDGSKVTISNKPSEYRVDGSQTWTYHKTHVFGRNIVDTMFLAVKHDVGRNYPSWGLKPIAQYEGLIAPDRQFYDASSIKDNWYDPVEREKIVAYGIADSDDTLALFDRMMAPFFYTNISLPMPLEEMLFGATGKWLNSILVRAYLQEGHSIPKADEPKTVYGGISWGNPGIYSNVFKIDVKSMYPSIILQHELYPKLKDPKKYYYTMVEYFTLKRFEQKRLAKETGDPYYEYLQAASKLFINSAFGLMGTPGLNFNDFNVANEITKHGRLILKYATEWATGRKLTEWWKEYDESKDL